MSHSTPQSHQQQPQSFLPISLPDHDRELIVQAAQDAGCQYIEQTPFITDDGAKAQAGTKTAGLVGSPASISAALVLSVERCFGVIKDQDKDIAAYRRDFVVLARECNLTEGEAIRRVLEAQGRMG